MRQLKATIGRGRNGEKIIRISGFAKDHTGFSIPTLYGLPQVHKQPIGTIFFAHAYTHLWKEIKEYISKYGTAIQKKKMGVE